MSPFIAVSRSDFLKPARKKPNEKLYVPACGWVLIGLNVGLRALASLRFFFLALSIELIVAKGADRRA